MCSFLSRDLRLEGLDGPLQSAPHRRVRHGQGRARGHPHQLDALVLAVSHQQYLDLPVETLTGMLCKGGLLLDVKSALDPARVGAGVRYWSL